MVNNNKTLKKVFVDTLKSPDGKWSRKSLTFFVSFIISIILGIYIVIAPQFNISVNEYSKGVFDSFMLLVAALSGITVVDKFTPSKLNKKEENKEA